MKGVLSTCLANSTIFCLQWKTLAWRMEEASAFDLEKNHSPPSRSSRPKPSIYVARKRSWQRWLWACPWKLPTNAQYLSSWARRPRGLRASVILNLHPMSYPPPILGPKLLRLLEGIWNCEWQSISVEWEGIGNVIKKSYSSPLTTMSMITRTKRQEFPCLTIYAFGSLLRSFVGHVGPAILAWSSLVAIGRLKPSSQ